MKKANTFLWITVLFVMFQSCGSTVESDQNAAEPIDDGKFAIVIHGGAGYRNSEANPEEDELYKEHLYRVVHHGEQMLKSGTPAIDVVESCIRMLENDSLFNAGIGAVLNAEGKAELDASIMNGEDRNAGAVAGVHTTRHPISAARMVMDSSKHVMLSGDGADTYAEQVGLEQVDPDFFITGKRKAWWNEQLKKREKDGNPDNKHGTVGCVVLDKSGHLAAGTSTGGMSNKQWGRIGDSPVIGAGTYADDQSCAVSCTGHGEYFIRNAVAYQIAARMQFGGEQLDSAVHTVLFDVLNEKAGSGGVIAVDKEGNISMQFNTSMMFRAWATDSDEGVMMYR